MEALSARLAALESALGDLKSLAASYRPATVTAAPSPTTAGAGAAGPKVLTSKYLVTGKGFDAKDDTKAAVAAGAPPGAAADTKADAKDTGAGAGDKAAAAIAAAAKAAPAAAPATVMAEVCELHAQWKRIEEKTFVQFFQKYAELQVVLESDVDLKGLLLSAAQKQTLLLSGARDFAQTAKLLEAMSALVSAMDKMPLQNVSAVVRRLSVAAAAVDARTAQVVQLHAEIDAFVDTYNAVIDLLSQKFVALDAQLSQWEQKVDAAVRKHAAQIAAAK